MPRRTEPLFDDNVLAENAELKEKNADLQQRIDFMSSELEAVRAMPSDDGEPRSLLSFNQHPDLFLYGIVGADLIRWLLFCLVEPLGMANRIAGITADVVCGSCVAWLFTGWVRNQWQRREWLAVPRGLLIAASVMFSISLYGGPRIWEGITDRPNKDLIPIFAGGMFLAAFLAAVPFCELAFRVARMGVELWDEFKEKL